MTATIQGTAATRLLDKLEAVKPTGANKWLARCPSHQDNNPSLAITSIDGRVLIYCFAGCKPESVVAALGMTMPELFDSPRELEYRYDGGRKVKRYYKSDGKKDFRQSNTSNPPELYKLGKVRAAVAEGRPIFLVEGEEDVRALESFGVCATSAPQGAANWSKANYTPLVGSTVLVVADNDKPGLARAADLAAYLPTIEVTLGGVFVAAAGLNDMGEHVAAGYTVNDLVEIHPPFTASGAGTSQHDNAAAEEPHSSKKPERALLLTAAANIRSSRQRWLWDGIIPLGTLALFAGRGGEGKSSFALHLAAKLNAGDLEGDFRGQPHAVLIAALEDDWGTIMKPRLVAAGADLNKTFKLGIAATVDETTRETVPTLPLDIGLIKEAIIQTGARMVILDPATSLMVGDLNKREDVRRSLDGLLAVAQETECTVVLIVHFAKGQGNVSEKISGSHALRDAARSVLLFATDEETGNRVVSMDKSNYSKHAAESFAFQLLDAAVETDDGETTHVARVNYLGVSDVTVSDIVNRGTDDGAESDRSEAERWLVSYLEDQHGSAPARDILKAARGDGLETQTVQRASRKVTSKAKSGFQGQWVWTLDLSKDVTKKSKMSRAREPDTFDPFEGNVTPLHRTKERTFESEHAE